MGKNKPVPIVINRMFTGDKYLNDSDNQNIGHEIINLFRADDEVNYIYFCDSGKYNSNDYQFPKYSFQVRPAGEKLLEIINIAEIADDLTIEVDKITYGGGFELVKIFADNKEQKKETFVTFKASRIIKAKSPNYIAYGGNKLSMPNCVNCDFKVNEHLRNYIRPNEKDYQTLYDFAEVAFKDINNWKDVDDKVTITEKGYKEPRTTPGDIYGISNLELPYSNAFKFFIEKYPQLLSGFCKHLQGCIKCKILDEICSYFAANSNFKIIKIEREWNNIDILIEVDDKWVIVIENKIFSDLNGKKENEITQLDKYEHIITTSKDSTDKAKYDGYNKIFILLLPDHNSINVDNYDNWHKLFYSNVSSYLNEFADNYPDEQLKDFAEMVARHSSKDYNYGVMRRRFERALLKIKAEQDKNKNNHL